MSVNSKMTAIADKIRALLGITGTMGMDAMASNLNSAVTEVDSQAALIQQIRTSLNGKVAGGGGGGGSSGITIGVKTETVSSNSLSISFSGLPDNPKMFSIIPTTAFKVDKNAVAVLNIVYDGSAIYGMYCTNQNTVYSDTYYSKAYSNGTLTVTSSASNAGGYFRGTTSYMLVYCV